jgi:hypothetical protein
MRAIPAASAMILLGSFPLPICPSAPPPSGQFPTLEAAAESARRAWSVRDLDAFLQGAGSRLLIELPSINPSTPVGRSQALALLQGYVQGTEEVVTAVRKAKPVDESRGYVELIRRYRLAGIGEVSEGVLLLGYRLGREGWLLTEVRAGN